MSLCAAWVREQVAAVAFSFGPLPFKTALRLLTGHWVTEAAPVPGKELMMHKCAVAHLEMTRLTSSGFPDDGINQKLSRPAQALCLQCSGDWWERGRVVQGRVGYTELENRWCGWCQDRAGQ